MGKGEQQSGADGNKPEDYLTVFLLENDKKQQPEPERDKKQAEYNFFPYCRRK